MMLVVRTMSIQTVPSTNSFQIVLRHPFLVRASTYVGTTLGTREWFRCWQWSSYPNS